MNKKAYIILGVSIVSMCVILAAISVIFNENEFDVAEYTPEQSSDFNFSKELLFVQGAFTISTTTKKEFDLEKSKSMSIPKYAANYTKMIRTNGCYSFHDKRDILSDLKLCDNMNDVRETKNYRYEEPIFIPEINSYIVTKVLYESARTYILNVDYPSTLVPTFGIPNISPDKKRFFVTGNDLSGYGDDIGIQFWNIYPQLGNISKIAELQSAFFNGSIEDSFWSKNSDVYFSLRMIGQRGVQYLKVHFK